MGTSPQRFAPSHDLDNVDNRMGHRIGHRIYHRIYNRFLQYVVYPNFWVAAAIASLVPFIQHVLHLPGDWRPVLLIFVAALLPYNIDRIVDTYVQEIPDQRLQQFFRKPGVWGVVAIASGTLAVLLYNAPPAVRWVSLGGLVPLLYGVPLLPVKRQGTVRWYRIKDIPGIKAWIVCGVITYAVVGVPLAYGETAPTLDVWVNSLFLLVFVGSNSHLFDVRDIASDRETGVLTMPVLLGVEGTRLFWVLANLGAIALLAWGWRQGLQLPSPIMILPLTLLTLGYVLVLEPDTRRDIYTVLVDGCLFLPVLGTVVLNCFP